MLLESCTAVVWPNFRSFECSSNLQSAHALTVCHVIQPMQNIRGIHLVHVIVQISLRPLSAYFNYTVYQTEKKLR